MRRTQYTLRHYFRDWRIYLLLLLLFGLFALGLVAGIDKEYRYRTFYEKARFAIQPDFAAGYLGLEGDFESFEQVWATYIDSPELAEYYYLSALCNASFAGTITSILLSFWIIGRGIQGRHASELVIRGASRGAAYRQLLCPYYFITLLLRWGFFALCFAILSIHTEYFPPGYFQSTVLCWLLLAAADTAFFGFTASAFNPLLAMGIDMGITALGIALPKALRKLIPIAMLNEKTLWTSDSFSGSFFAAVISSGVILLVSLAAGRIAFQRKTLL